MHIAVQIVVVLTCFVLLALAFYAHGIRRERQSRAAESGERSLEWALRIVTQLCEKQSTDIIESSRHARDMASVMPEDQLSRHNAEMIHNAGMTGISPIDQRRDDPDEGDPNMPISLTPGWMSEPQTRSV